MRKYIGRWVEKGDEFGNHEYGTVLGSSKDSAYEKAVVKARARNEIEWVQVSEETWVGDKRAGHWEETARWTGDYEYLEQIL